MALVVESTASNSGNNLGTLTVTAPSGITVGDLLISVSSNYSQANPPMPTGFTASYTYSFEDGGSGDISEREHAVRVGYRVADSGDASATDYDFVFSGDSGGAACILRVSGWTSGDSLFSSANSFDDGTTGLAVERPHGQLLLMIGAASCTDGSPGFSWDGYSVTSSDTNPTWTEVMDSEYFANGGTDTAGLVLAVAYAVTTDTSDITAFSATLTEGTSDPIGQTVGLVVIVEPTDASGTNDFFTASSTTFNNTAVEVGTNGTNDFHNVSPNLPTQSGNATAPTQWTNETKNDTDWTNESKL